MDVKSAFLNGPLSELVYVEQPPGFEDPKRLNHMYKLHKVLYRLKQAPRAWYECLREFLLKNGFVMGKADSTLFTQKVVKIFLFVKFMLMTLSLVLLMKSFVKSLVGS